MDGILGQETDFEFEIVIGEDKSTDNTFDIVSSYSEKNKTIRVLDNKSNLGALPNFIRTLKEARGEYIAFCEGDDFWVDSKKLHKQVRFLQKNVKYGGVCTNNSWFYEDTRKMKPSLLPEGEIYFSDIVKSNVINSQSILFRRNLLPQDIDWIGKLKIGDWPLHHLICSKKPYYRLGENMTVYRVHSGGVHSQLSKLSRLENIFHTQLACLKYGEFSKNQLDQLKGSLILILKRLLRLKNERQSYYRAEYRKLGGEILNKNFLLSYI